MNNYIINQLFNSITYIIPIGDKNDCWLVDCGDIDKVIKQGWHVRGVLLTHTHTDHIYGINKLFEKFPNAIVYTNEYGKYGLQNPRWNFSHYHEDVEDFVISKPENVKVLKNEGDLAIESLDLEILFTPGHDPSCLAYRIGEQIFTGDSYIPGVKVVTNFPRSNKQQAAESLARLKALENSGMKIMPGHWVDEKY